jgi:hypothetical protein
MHRPGREAQGLEARTQENLVAICVVDGLFQLFMVAAIDFDDKPAAQAEEVGIVTQERSLPSKVEAFRPQGPKPPP